MRRPERADLLLLFPGVTEARHFPYMSLPQLTAFCRKRGYDARQRDINIELSRALLTADAMARKLASGRCSPLQSAVLSHLLSQSQHDHIPDGVATRIQLNALDIMLAGSVLVQRARCLDDVIALSAAPATEYDVAAHLFDVLVRDAVLAARPLVVGLSVAFFSQLAPALRAARIVREVLPDALVVLGGQQVMMRKHELGQVPGLHDIGPVLADTAGETVLPGLIDAKRRRTPADAHPDPPASRPARWRFRDNPPPVFDGLPLQDYFADRQLPVVSCIGCYWGRCTFCSYGNRSLREGYQQLDHHALAAVVCDGLAATGARRVTFVDENSNLKVLVRAMELVRARGHDVVWSTRNRMEPMLAVPAVCRRLADSGCVLMSVGYETISQRLLDAMDKGVAAATYQAIVDNLDDAGIALRLSVLGGVPGETAAEAAESTRFLVANARKLGIDVAQMLIVEPGTLLAAAMTRQGASRDRREGSLPLTDNTGFSYLGGRAGRSADYSGTASRDERAAWLGKLVASVFPGKNDEQHPRFRAEGHTADVWRLHLNPWLVEAGDGGDRLYDVRWKLTYRLGSGVVRTGREIRAENALAAARLGLLAAADAGTAVATPHGEEVSP